MTGGHQKTILFAWELGGGLGHLIPSVPLVRRFRSAGHRVVLGVRDLSRVNRLFGRFGVELLQAPIKTSRPDHRVALPRSIVHILHNCGFGEFSELCALAEAWRHLMEHARPDLVLCDHAPMALLVSRALGAKRATTGTGFCCPPDVYPLPDFRPWMADAADALRRDEDRLTGSVNRLLDAWGLAPLERLGQLYGDVDECFLATFRELDHYRMRGGARYWGAWPSTGGAPPVWPEAPGKRVFAYLKPFKTVPHVLHLLRQMQVTTLAYVDRLDPKLKQRCQSPTLRFSPRPLDLEQVGHECDLAILNAGHGSTVSMLRAGRPILQIPLNLEQTLTGVAVERMGAGLHAEATDPAQIAAKLTALLQSDQYAGHAARFATRYCDFDPQRQLDRLADRVNDLLEGDAPDVFPAVVQGSDRVSQAEAGGEGGAERFGGPGTRSVSAEYSVLPRKLSMIVGLGSGRCGTRSLAELLNRQPSTAVLHEGPPWLPWNKAEARQDVRRRFEDLVARYPQVARVGDVAHFYLPYIEDILEAFPQVRVLSLKRDRGETVGSFVRWLGSTRPGRAVNHWSADRAGFDADPWDATFPKYATRHLPEAIGRYWDDYYDRCEQLARAYPERFRIFDVGALNDPASIAEILTFAGVPGEQQVVVVVHTHRNASSDAPRATEAGRPVVSS